MELTKDSLLGDDMESSILDWELMQDSRADAERDAFLDDLEKNIKNEAVSYPLEEEQRIIAFLLDAITLPQKSEQAIRCLALYVRHKLRDTVLVGAIADHLYDYFVTEEHSEAALSALKSLITELPPPDFVRMERHSRSCQMAVRLVEALAPRVTGGVTKNNVTESMTIMAMLLRHFGPIFRNHAKLTNMMFLPESHYFCTGVELGKGSYANVFLGRNIHTAEVVAIKSMDWEKLTQGRSKLVKQLENEITIMRESNHQNIVKLHDVVRQAGFLHLILEYCGGGSLEEYLYKKGALSEEETLHWLRQLAMGLKFLHDRNIIHRDLKPGNLLLSANSPTAQLKITDFTFARFIEPGDLATTLVGTPLYMAPEIFLQRQYTEKSDLWSIGVILYQMLTGSIPYRGSNVLELVEDIKAHDPIWPEGIKISADMKDLLKALLQRDARLRITWTEFFLHPCLDMVEDDSSSDDMKGSLDQSVICQETATEDKDLTEARETLRGIRAELEARNEELKAAKRELLVAKERLELSEEVISDMASKMVQLELKNDELEKTKLRLMAEKKAAEQRVEELKAQVLLLATKRLADSNRQTEDLQAALAAEKEKNERLTEQVSGLETQLEVYKVSLEAIDNAQGIEWKALDWRSFIPTFKGN